MRLGTLESHRCIPFLSPKSTHPEETALPGKDTATHYYFTVSWLPWRCALGVYSCFILNTLLAFERGKIQMMLLMPQAASKTQSPATEPFREFHF